MDWSTTGMAPACPYPDESGERERWLEGRHEPDQAEAEELGSREGCFGLAGLQARLLF